MTELLLIGWPVVVVVGWTHPKGSGSVRCSPRRYDWSLLEQQGWQARACWACCQKCILSSPSIMSKKHGMINECYRDGPKPMWCGHLWVPTWPPSIVKVLSFGVVTSGLLKLGSPTLVWNSLSSPPLRTSLLPSLLNTKRMTILRTPRYSSRAILHEDSILIIFRNFSALLFGMWRLEPSSVVSWPPPTPLATLFGLLSNGATMVTFIIINC